MSLLAITSISDGSAFLWGCVGGFAALAVTQLLPLGIAAAKSGQGWTLTPWRIAGVLVVFAIFVAIGGIVAIAMGDAVKPGQAIFYGIGSQAIVAGAFKAGKAATGS